MRRTSTSQFNCRLIQATVQVECLTERPEGIGGERMRQVLLRARCQRVGFCQHLDRCPLRALI